MQQLKHFWLMILAILATGFSILLIRFWPMFFADKTLLFGDNYSLMVPGKIFTANWLARGVLPLWNPNIFGGLSWIDDINQSIIYPTTLFFWLMPPAAALNFSIISHLLFTFLGMFFLAKYYLKDKYFALLAAAMWLLSTQVTGNINNLSTLQSIAFVPWVIWLAIRAWQEKRALFWLGLMVTLQLLGGYPQYVVFSLIIGSFLSLLECSCQIKSATIWFAKGLLIALVVISMSTIAWLPFLEGLTSSTRMEQTSEQAAEGALRPIMLASKPILPYFFDNSAMGMKWGPAWSDNLNLVFYLTWFGLLALFVWLIGLVGREHRDYWWLGLALVTTLLSLGENLPGFALLQTLIPLFRIGRSPSMLMIFANLALIMLVASILKRWFELKLKVSFLIFALALIGAAVAAALLYVSWSNNFAAMWLQIDGLLKNKLSSSTFHTISRDQIILWIIAANLLVNSLLFALAIWAFNKRWRIVFFSIIVLDLIYNTQAQFFFAPNKIYDLQKTKLVSALSEPEKYRTLTRSGNVPYTNYDSYWEAMVVRAPFSDSFVTEKELANFEHAQALKNGLVADWNFAWDVPIINGYTTLLPNDFATLWQTSATTRINFIDQIALDNKLLKEWSVKYYIVDRWFKIDEASENLNSKKLLASFGRYEVRELPDSLPRIRLQNLADVNYKIENFRENPNELSFEVRVENVDADANLELIIADRYDKNWRAWVNGAPATIDNHNGMRLIKQPAQAANSATYTVKMLYIPILFYVGTLISLVASTATFIITFISTHAICLLNKRGKSC